MITAFLAPTKLDALKELPKRLLMAPWGRTSSTKGDVIVNEKTVRMLPKLQKLAGFNRVMLDFQHNTVPGTEEYKADKEPRAIAAECNVEVVPGEGLYFNVEKWTPEGEAAVKAGHFPALSPAAVFSPDREIIFIHSGAVCRQGAMEKLSVFSAEEPAGLLAAIEVFSVDINQRPASSMNHKTLLLQLLGLAETATDEMISGAVKTFTASVSALAEAKNKLETFSTTLTALAKRLDDQDRAAISHAALLAGKIVPMSASELPLEQFRKLVSELPADQVPLEKRTPEGIKTFTPAGFTAARNGGGEEVRNILGISEESWNKHKVG